nr:hypothetical protein BACY1_21100 [Tenacibaculum mesophilum]
MNITTPQDWPELNNWQQREIAYLYLNSTEYNFEKNILQILKITIQKKKSFLARIKAYSVFSQVTVDVLMQHHKFLLTTPSLNIFPKVKKLIAPGPRLNNISIKQFSVADAIFFKWKQTNEEVYLYQLAASLYSLKTGYDSLKLPEVAKITDKLPLKTIYQIALVYLSVRTLITSKYPIVFPKLKEEEEEQLKPVFKKKSYTPFSKIITTMAMDERQPLGVLSECNKTNVYDFFNVLEESIIRHEEQEKALKKS